MKTRSQWVFAAAISSALAMVSAFAADDKAPIKIVTNNWTSQVVLSYVVGDVLKSKGINVEYKPSDTQLQFTAIAAGDMDFQVEVWEGSMNDNFQKSLKNGAVDYGAHNAVTREDWWYPSYMNEMCPGLPDWKALDKCAAKLATAETGTKGRFVGPPADWGKHYSERITALKMNFQEVSVGQAATLWAELQAAYDPKCHTDKSWGMNPDALYDCGAAAKGYMKKVGSKNIASKWPTADKILRKVNFTNDQIAAAALMVDVDGMKPEAAAKKWLAANQASVKAWTN